MKKLLLLLMVVILLWSCNQSKHVDDAAELNAIDFADAKYTLIGRECLMKLAEGDMDAFMNNFSDDAMYIWNNGDSIAGKSAITAYWKDRRTNAVDTITFKREAWLPIQANEPPEHLKKGVWLLNWSSFDITYVNGKVVTQNIHTVFHFDSSDKIDRVVQYIDRAPINAAMASE